MSNKDMSIVDHLEELRWRILKSLGSIILMSILTFNFANYLVDILIKPASQINSDLNLQVLTIQGMFLLKWNLAIIGGIILSLPVITVQVWKFLSPGLYDKEKKILVPLILTAFVCFILGGLFAYKVILPFSLDFFASMITADIQNNYYKDLIEGKVLRPLEIRIVKKDGFSSYMKRIGKLGGQNKVPRLTNDRKIADELIIECR